MPICGAHSKISADGEYCKRPCLDLVGSPAQRVFRTKGSLEDGHVSRRHIEVQWACGIPTFLNFPFRSIPERKGEMSEWRLNLGRSQPPLNQRVAGSSPAAPTKSKSLRGRWVGFLRLKST